MKFTSIDISDRVYSNCFFAVSYINYELSLKYGLYI